MKKIGIGLIAVSSSTLVGCAIHPLPEDVSRKATYDIVDKIRCEAKAAVEDYGRGFGDAKIVYNFTFDITENNDASAGFTLTDPFKSGIFNLTAGADLNRIRSGNRNFQFIDSFNDLRKMNCSRDREANWLYPLTGDVGMYEAVATFIRLQHAENPGAGKLFTFADTLNYTTTLNGSANSTLTLTPVNDRLRFTAANAGLTGSRTDNHKVVVTMAAESQTTTDRSGKLVTRRMAPVIDSRLARNVSNGGPGTGFFGNTLLSTRLLEQDSGAENRALYEQDRQRQLELQRQSNDVRVLVGQ